MSMIRFLMVIKIQKREKSLTWGVIKEVLKFFENLEPLVPAQNFVSLRQMGCLQNIIIKPIMFSVFC